MPGARAGGKGRATSLGSAVGRAEAPEDAADGGLGRAQLLLERPEIITRQIGAGAVRRAQEGTTQAGGRRIGHEPVLHREPQHRLQAAIEAHRLDQELGVGGAQRPRLGSLQEGLLGADRAHRRVVRQQAQLQVYRQNIALREKVAERDEQILRQQKRIAHLRFQQAYRQRLQQQRTALVSARYDYYEDPFFYTGPSYRYRRDGRYYMTNEIGMEALKQALNQGYKEGVRAGRADREDEWRFDPRSSFAYQDAYYGYDGRHLEQDEYQHYFREGFERGYEDGYYGRRKYGSGGDDDDEWWIAAGVVAAVLAYQALDD